ncbi:hypothetical protein PLESTB_001200700 [Pleodorina starrii]|uniref:Rhodanese domain-containing protein n=1 Tax=Pleodorina starrii TaxID=330485 RepID=A0A9W6BSM8_9CHLO|nr:hypothetical protein PLESTM_001806100 [Pleodorina starrii]GLC57220.1 hypothetical protein PLESTB_001200700 [Pleodorina starrii]GLC71391.1 hypothetical protein PLESTF_001110400 [Pleodorina starrii]
MSVVEYLEPVQLATALRHPQQKDRVLVLDVRDEDFAGGHIRGAVNAPSEDWADDPHIDGLIDAHLKGKDTVVVHCMFSQQRGPRCAMRLARRLDARMDASRPAVYVLRGGFTGFVRQYRHEHDLVEGYEQAC